ncbi:prepilin peptidase [Weissella diestrammenae]|uniref:Prepilin peptidase n=1 Tax=Weissella diestrammenae TaxID=1162633 RepID=A0A7G9T6C8_9LACO|nr:prepilin peptidase [Weissella diestrammenae]MCM0583301.1 prepilin peptidase [Weissella diestrammenae]QNN75653.1 prepilin peptidase [Weissella diestrammenae]
MSFMFTFVLLFLSWQDWQTYQISSWLLMPIIWLASLSFKIMDMLLVLGIYILTLFVNKLSEKYIGSGDIDIMFTNFLVLNDPQQWLLWLTLSSLLAYGYAHSTKRIQLPFVPFLTIANILNLSFYP